MITELGLSPTRSGNVYFANNEQASIAVFTVVFCFTHAEHNLWNSKKPIKFPHLSKFAN